MPHYKFNFKTTIKNELPEIKRRVAEEGCSYAEARMREVDITITCTEEDAKIIYRALEWISYSDIEVTKLNQVGVYKALPPPTEL